MIGCFSPTMPLYFITGNKNKFAEAQSIYPDLKQLDIDLTEIQETDARKVIAHKVREAFQHHPGPFVVEDIALHFDALNGLPGTLIKWFLKHLSLEQLAAFGSTQNKAGAEARAIIGYAKNPQEIHFFEGSIKGTVVMPRGKTGFGWDPLFVPEGHSSTFAEMGVEEKNKISMRKIAFQKLAEFLGESHTR